MAGDINDLNKLYKLFIVIFGNIFNLLKKDHESQLSIFSTTTSNIEEPKNCREILTPKYWFSSFMYKTKLFIVAGIISQKILFYG